jgi:predicted esterase
MDYVDFSCRARYYTQGTLGEHTKYVWLVCHGYGHLSEYFKRKFQHLGEEHFLIFPEGLHRFYLNGTEGRVGASWMTKENRETDILNYVNYLDQVVSKELKQATSHYEFVAFGFSQGTATIGRWAMSTQQSVNHLVMWAGAFPKDVNLGVRKEKIEKMSVHIACGDEDEFINDERLNTHLRQLDEKEISYDLLHFKGTHDVPALALSELENRIRIRSSS